MSSVYSIDEEEALISAYKHRSTGAASLAPASSSSASYLFGGGDGGDFRSSPGFSSSSSSSRASLRWRSLCRNWTRNRVVLFISGAITCCLLLSFLGIFVAPSTTTSTRTVFVRGAVDSLRGGASGCDCQRDCGTANGDDKRALKGRSADDVDFRGHKLSVIVPFRDRFDELMLFVPNLSRFLIDQNVAFEILVINQADSHRFNRAALINAGFLLSSNDTDYIAMHDVDLWPLNSNLSYAYPAAAPYHVAAPGLHPLYNYPTFVGGILLVSKAHYKRVNGLSNLFWGWGREDDDFYLRLKAANLPVHRPSLKDVTTGRQNTFMHFHGPNRKRDQIRYDQQKKISRQMDVTTGLNDVSYSVTRTQRLSIEGFPATVHHVTLTCDYSLTPWCDHLLSEEEIAAVLARQKRERAERRRKKEEEKRRKLEAMAEVKENMTRR